MNGKRGHLLMLLETSGPTPRAERGTMAKSCTVCCSIRLHARTLQITNHAIENPAARWPGRICKSHACFIISKAFERLLHVRENTIPTARSPFRHLVPQTCGTPDRPTEACNPLFCFQCFRTLGCACGKHTAIVASPLLCRLVPHTPLIPAPFSRRNSMSATHFSPFRRVEGCERTGQSF
jgi:hypothetical protein